MEGNSYKIHKRIQFTKEFRIKIFERDNYECQICFKNLIRLKEERVIDHKIPLSKGGTNSITNLWLLCDGCDKRKKDNINPDLAKQYIEERLKQIDKKKRVRNYVKNNNKKNL